MFFLSSLKHFFPLLDIRSEEKRELQKMAIAQGSLYTLGSVNSFIAPLVSIITAISIGEETTIENVVNLLLNLKKVLSCSLSNELK